MKIALLCLRYREKLWCVGFLWCVFMAGCASDTIRVPESGTLLFNGVEDGSQSLVLFKLTVTRDGETLQPFDSIWPLELVELGLVDKDSGSQMDKISAYSPSVEAKAQGWFYVLVPPGHYQLWIVPPVASFGIFEDHTDFVPMPAVHVEVPHGGAWQYGGSIHLVCTAGTGFWSQVVLEACDETPTVTNDREEAQEVADRLANEPVTFRGELGQAQIQKVPDGWLKRGPRMVMVEKGPNRWQAPLWTNRALERAGATPHGVAMSAMGFGGISSILYLLYLPVGITIGEVSGSSNQKTWQPCMENLERVLQQLDLQKVWTKTLGESLQAQGMEVGRRLELPENSMEVHDGNLLWMTGVQRVQLRECEEDEQFCLEISLRLQIRGPADATDMFDKFLLYSNTTGRPDPFYERPFQNAMLPFHRTYESLLPEESPCRPLEAYCQDEFHSLLSEEIQRAFEGAARQYLQRVGVSQE